MSKKDLIDWADFWNTLSPYMSIDGNGIHPDDVRKAINKTFNVRVTRDKEGRPYSCVEVPSDD